MYDQEIPPLVDPRNLRTRDVHMFLLLDCSSSMEGYKIAQLNQAIREALLAAASAASDAPEANLLLRVIAFSSGARWHIQQPTPLAQVIWTDLPARGVTDMGAAFALLNGALNEGLGNRLRPPVALLVSDGQPTDNWEARLTALESNKYWKHVVRLAVAIGDDVEMEPLERFIKHKELKVFKANQAKDIKEEIIKATIVLTSSGLSGDSPGKPKSNDEDDEDSF